MKLIGFNYIVLCPYCGTRHRHNHSLQDRYYFSFEKVTTRWRTGAYALSFFAPPEDEQIPPIPTKEQPKNNWDDEDVDDDGVKESWEDEDEPTPAPETKPPVEKAPKKVKAAEKKGKTVEVVKEEPLDPVAEKLRQQRNKYYFLHYLLEQHNVLKLHFFFAMLDSDCWYLVMQVGFSHYTATCKSYEPTASSWTLLCTIKLIISRKQLTETASIEGLGFGGMLPPRLRFECPWVQTISRGHVVPLAKPMTYLIRVMWMHYIGLVVWGLSGLVEEADYKSTKELFGERGDEKTLDNFIPKSESDFLEYAELVSNKLRPFEKSYHYITLLKAVMRLSMTTLKAADAKDVASSVSAIANEKLKAEKEANAGKKKGPKKKQLHVDKPDDDIAVTSYDALDDYDFM
uniref:Eukaryotic translation initiation factor 3 30 kDa subunit n=1 Tax=Quercus lobata TaxID=97700 RepID=A0A7N2M5V4_QUELO